MATDTRALPAYINTDALFRSWVQGIEAQLVAAGLVVTGDTGQIDPTTVTKPVGGTVMAGFRMYRFDDALQTTKPIFIRIDYGNASASNAVGFTVRVGTATNGAGTLTGVTLSTSHTTYAGAAKLAGDTLNSYCSGSQSGSGGGRVFLLTNFDPASSSYSMGICIERLKNGDGSVHSTGATVVAFIGNTSNISTQILVHGNAPGAETANWPSIPLSGVGNQQPNVGTDLALAPFFFSLGVWLYITALNYRDSDLARLTPFTMTHLGASRTFMPFGPNVSNGAYVQGQVAASQGLAIPWE